MSFIVCDWPDLTTAYPERITYHNNKIGIPIGGDYNEIKAGLCLWAVGFRLCSQLKYPKVPVLWFLVIAFFAKPEMVKCWKKWWHYCWLELKDHALLSKHQAVYVMYNHLWILRTFDGKFMVWTEYADIDPKVDKGSLKQYRWSSKDNAYLPFVHKPMSVGEEILTLAMLVRC